MLALISFNWSRATGLLCWWTQNKTIVQSVSFVVCRFEVEGEFCEDLAVSVSHQTSASTRRSKEYVNVPREEGIIIPQCKLCCKSKRKRRSVYSLGEGRNELVVLHFIGFIQLLSSSVIMKRYYFLCFYFNPS